MSTRAHQTIYECLVEALDGLRAAVHLADGVTVQGWYDDGADVNVFCNFKPPGTIIGLRAWGYLQGAADMANVTVMELLADYGLSLDAPPTRKRRNARQLARGAR